MRSWVFRMRLAKGLLQLQLLNLSKRAICFNPPSPMHRACTRRVTTTFSSRTALLKMAAASHSSCDEDGPNPGSDEKLSVFYLRPDGRWVDYKKAFPTTFSSFADEDHLRDTLDFSGRKELQYHARTRGLNGNGTAEELRDRILSDVPPAPRRPPRRKPKPPGAPFPEGYVHRQPTNRPPALHPYTRQLRVLSWNVNGFRALLKKEEGKKALKAILAQERPHVLGLQEVRISPHEPFSNNFDGKQSFDALMDPLVPEYYTIFLSSVPPVRTSYAGTALMVRKRRGWDTGCPRLLNVRGGIGNDTPGDLEGRVTTAEFDVAFVVNVYTPNSGAGLKRLDFRTEWDKAFAAYVRGLEKIKPVIVIGDLNVAHEDTDFYNSELTRTRKAAGTTPEERNSFAKNLLGRYPTPSSAPTARNLAAPSAEAVDCAAKDQAGSAALTGRGGEGDGKREGLKLVDTFRELHPNARGVFSFWSTRARNRPQNRGLRLDYCLASPCLVDGTSGCLHDAFVLDEATVGMSDHCPVGAVLRLGDHYTKKKI